MNKTNLKAENKKIKKDEIELIKETLLTDGDLGNLHPKFILQTYPEKPATRIHNMKFVETTVHSHLVLSKLSNFVHMFVYSTYKNEKTQDTEIFSIDIVQTHKKP